MRFQIALFIYFFSSFLLFAQIEDEGSEYTEKAKLPKVKRYSNEEKIERPKPKNEKPESSQRKPDISADNDELPFKPPKNIFGDKKIKDGILDRLEYRIGFLSEGGLFNNADLRKLNETNQFTIESTDDKINLAYSRFYLNLFFTLTERLYFRIDLFKNGFWGDDQLSGKSTNNDSSSTLIGADPFAFGELYLQGIIVKKRSLDISVKIGRQFFEVGGIPNDYMLRDYLDAITVQVAHSNVGTLRILGVDFFQGAADPTLNINYVRFFSRDAERVANFDGDVSVLRFGAVYESSNIFNWNGPISENAMSLQARAYSFYARYGAVNQGGSDRTNLGSTGNFADNDYNIMVGSRLIFKLSDITVFTDAALSKGIDRKLPSASGSSQDINNDGIAAGAGIRYYAESITPTLGLDFIADGFWAQGSKFNDSGVQTSHGFVSFKGNQMGGFLTNRYWGTHPTAYTDDDGIDDFPFDYDRKAGSLFLHIGGAIVINRDLRIGLDGWYMTDTGSSSVTTPDTTVKKAQQRLGKTIGTEIDLSIDYSVNDFWSLYFKTAIFLPGSFYDSQSFITPKSPYGTDRFWGILIGSKLVF